MFFFFLSQDMLGFFLIHHEKYVLIAILVILRSLGDMQEDSFGFAILVIAKYDKKRLQKCNNY